MENRNRNLRYLDDVSTRLNGRQYDATACLIEGTPEGISTEPLYASLAVRLAKERDQMGNELPQSARLLDKMIAHYVKKSGAILNQEPSQQ